MHDGVVGTLGEHGGRVSDRSLDELRAWRHGVVVAGRQVVEHGDLVPAVDQQGRDDAADVARRRR